MQFPLLLLLAASAADKTATLQCHEAVDHAIKQKPTSVCTEVDPACNTLKGSAERVAATKPADRKRYSEACTRKVHGQCETYGQLRAAGRDEATALRCALGDCAKTLKGMQFVDVQCSCFYKGNNEKECGLESALPAMLPAPESVAPVEQR